MNQVEKNNRLIVEFMGFYRDELCVIVNMQSYPYDQLKFDFDWNWLMLVVDRIESMGWNVVINQNKCGIYKFNDVDVPGKSNIFSSKDQPNKHQAVYTEVVNFIKWQNYLKEDK